MKGYLQNNPFTGPNRSTSRGVTSTVNKKPRTPTISSSFKVCVRIRPLLNKELVHNPKYPRHSNQIVKCTSDKNLTLHDSDLIYEQISRDKHFTFDHVFEEKASNKQVYQTLLQPSLQQVRDGYNVTCFAYGMTGAGKTHTMFGDKNQAGLADLCIEGLNGSQISVSFLEIYNETVKDLLQQ